MSSKFMIKSLDKKFLSGVLALVFLLTISLSVTALSQENQPGEQNVFRQASLQWMKVGVQQYRRDLFTEAERSFRRAHIFHKFLTDPEREQLNELLENARIAISGGKQAVKVTKSADESFEPNQPVKAKMIVEKVKESEPSIEKELKQIKEEPVLITEGGEQTEERTKTEAQLQAQAQAYAALEEQLKAETQARLKAQQEAEAQTKQRAIIEAEYAEAVSAAKARATEDAELHAIAIREHEQKLESLAEEITRAEAKAESESKARLEAEKIAGQEAEARIELEKQLRAEAELRAAIQVEADKAIIAAKVDAEAKTESYAATIKQLEEKLKVQTEEAAKTEAQLQAQNLAYAALEEQLKVEMQARIKAQQEAQTQAQAKIRAETTTEVDVIDQATQNKVGEFRQLPKNKEPTFRNRAVEELDQTGGLAVSSLINHNTPKEKTIDMGNGVTMEFVLIPAWEFDMGSSSTESDRSNDEGPVCRVKISRPFYMGKYEVTQEQYYTVAKYSPSRFKQENGPVERISWDQAVTFCRKLSEIKGGTYRLPTEAEWEYACRAGSQDRFYFGSDPIYAQIEQYAWYSENSDSTTHPVGEKKPNSFGLYDMHGNVSEWCGDWYAADYYHHILMVDPPGPPDSKLRVLRGGSWFDEAKYCRSASRSNLESVYIRNYVGFRVVLELE